MDEMKVVKKLTGFKEAGQEPYTYVIMDREKYEDYHNKILNAEAAWRRAENKAAEDLREANRAINVRVQQAEEEARIKIREAQEEMEYWKNSAEDLEIKNKNLIRIAKERANADRKLQPKKERSGYILQNMDQAAKTFVFAQGKQNKTVKRGCWKIKLQTPYEALMSFTAAQKSVADDMQNEFANSIGIQKIYENSSVWNENTVNTLWGGDDNFAFDFTYKLNAIRGYWEVELYTRYSITVVPDILATK